MVTLFGNRKTRTTRFPGDSNPQPHTIAIKEIPASQTSTSSSDFVNFGVLSHMNRNKIQILYSLVEVYIYNYHMKINV